MNKYTNRIFLRGGENLEVWHQSFNQPDEIMIRISIGKCVVHIDLTSEEQQELVKSMEEARKVAISNCSEIPNGSDKENNDE